MATTVIATLPDRGSAHLAVERLHAAGIPPSDISMVMRDPERVEEPVVIERGSAAGAGAAAGGILGALGGLLVGLVALAVPGVGPLLVAGPLAAILGGTAIGAATGGLVGALIGLGVPEEQATVYVTHVEQGHVLLTVRADEARAARVRDILVQSGAANLNVATAPV